MAIGNQTRNLRRRVIREFWIKKNLTGINQWSYYSAGTERLLDNFKIRSLLYQIQDFQIKTGNRNYSSILRIIWQQSFTQFLSLRYLELLKTFFFRRLKAKRALFSGKGRSLSLASFSLPVRKVPRLLPLVRPKNQSPKLTKPPKPTDEKYLEENKAQGELEILGLESLIDITDVQHHPKK